jgi:hypothetical protein
MSLINRFARTALVFSSPVLFACGDDAVKPGGLVVHWTHGATATCGTRGVDAIEARVLKGTELIATGNADCATDARTGTVAIADIAPGSYTIQVEAFEPGAEPKGTYIGTLERQSVSEGKNTDTPDITLAQKPATLAVDWSVPGGKCSSSSIKEVEVTIYYNAGTTSDVNGAPQKVVCDGTYKDPVTGTDKAGVYFSNLLPEDDVVIVAYGLDAAKKKIARGTTTSFAITAGDSLSKVLTLETCAGDPPACN